jgi:hypothetical protein
MPVLDQVDELTEDRAGLPHVRVVALERQPVAPEQDRAAEPVAHAPEDAVVDGREFRGDLIGNGQNFLQRAKCSRGLRGV